MSAIRSASRRMSIRRLSLITVIVAVGTLLASAGVVVVRAQETKQDEKKVAEKKASPHPSQCETCHVGIESMHANKKDITCVECHGGDDTVSTKEEAHVQPRSDGVFANDARPANSYSYLNLESTEFIRFLNPSDLRVADKACGDCHADIVDSVKKSIMSTNAMAHNAVFYNNGAIASKIPIYGEGFDAKSQPAAIFPDPAPTREAQDRGALT